MRYPYYPYFPVVLDILHSRAAEQVLDAPCGTGWLGDNLRRRGAASNWTAWGCGSFPKPTAATARSSSMTGNTAVAESPVRRRRLLRSHPPVTNPGVLVESLRRALRPGGTVVITTPNTVLPLAPAVPAARFHSGFRPMVGRQRAGLHHVFPLELSAAASAAVALRLRGHHAARGRRGQAQADAGASAGAAVAPVLPAADQARRKRGSAAVLARSRARPVGAWPLAGGVGARRSVEDMAACRGRARARVARPRARAVLQPASSRQAALMPLWRSNASIRGARPRKAAKDSAAGREPPTASTSRRKRAPVSGSSVPSAEPDGWRAAASSKAS